MPTIRYLALSELPQKRRGRNANLQAAIEHLGHAASQGKVLALELGVAERAASVVHCYKRAVAELGIKVRFSYGPSRPYTNRSQRVVSEPSVIYVEVPAKVAPPAAVSVLRPVAPVEASVPPQDPAAPRRQREAAELREERQQEMDAMLNRRPGLKPSTGTKGVWERG